MAHAFERRGDRFVATLSADERAVIASFCEQTVELLESASPTSEPDVDDAPKSPALPADDAFEDLMRRAGWQPGVDPLDAAAAPGTHLDDPALRRLLPAAHRDDPQLAAAFRRLSGDNVRTRKISGLRVAVDALRSAEGDELSVDAAAGQALLVALTDVRLVLAERLDIHTDDDAEHLEAQLAALAQGDEHAQAMLVYDFLTWLQETLASAMLGP